MHSVRFICRLAAAIFLLPALAGAQQPPLSLEQAQRIALARSWQLAAQDAALAGVRESAIAAGQLPDPVLKLGVDNLPVNGPDRFSLSRDFMTMRRIGLSQEWTRADKRGLKVERLGAEGRRIQAERALAFAAIQRDTSLAWAERRYAQATLELLRRQRGETALQIQGAEVAYRNARGTQADVFSARAALANVEDRFRQSERQAATAGLMLARWVGPEAVSRPADAILPWQQNAPPPAAGAPAADHLRSHPQLAVLAAQVQMAETEVRQAQANTRPDWTVEAAYQQRGSAYSNMVSVGVSIPLQLDPARRQDREVAARQASLSASRARLDDALQAHEAEVQIALGDWNSGKERSARLTAQLLPQAHLRTEAALTAYQTGKGDLAAVLAARRDDIEAQLQVLAIEAETARAWANLNYLLADSHSAGEAAK